MQNRQKNESDFERRIELKFLEGVRRRLPDSVPVLKALGDLYTRCGRIHEGLEVDIHLSTLCGSEAEVWYNLACSYSLLKEVDAALASLDKAVDFGYNDLNWMLQDDDLADVRGSTGFGRILQRLMTESDSFQC